MERERAAGLTMIDIPRGKYLGRRPPAISLDQSFFYRFGNDFLHISLVIKFDLSLLQSDFLNAILEREAFRRKERGRRAPIAAIGHAKTAREIAPCSTPYTKTRRP
jgi:hypothetical protein